MLGLAVGDALGITTEGQLPADRRLDQGVIRGYLPNRHVRLAPGQPALGYSSDDTQLAFWALEQVVEDDGLVPERVARRFTRGRIFGVGSAVKAFLRELKSGKLWFLCGQHSAGNGALMRIAPVLIPPAAGWWVSRFVETASDLELPTLYTPRGGSCVGWKGTLSAFVREKVEAARSLGLDALAACNGWHSGAYLLETVPSVLYILERHGHNPEEAIVRAVNGTKDNDSIAAIVGAAVGALHGKKKLPAPWVERLTGRTTDRDDGKVFEILALARRRWGTES